MAWPGSPDRARCSNLQETFETAQPRKASLAAQRQFRSAASFRQYFQCKFLIFWVPLRSLDRPDGLRVSAKADQELCAGTRLTEMLHGARRVF